MLRSILLASAFAACVAGPAMAAPAQTWTGFYVGVNAGFGGDKFTYPVNGTLTDLSPDEDTDPVTSFSGSASQNSSGFLGGGQVGYNYQFSNGFVLGAEADIDASSIEGKVALLGASTGGITGTAAAQLSSKLDYLGTVRMRAGWPVADGRFVPFISGGLAYGQVSSSASIGVTPGSGSGGTALSISQHSMRTGWTLGAGADYAITDKLSFRAEYLYVDLGTKTLLSGSSNLGQSIGDLFVIGDSDETLAGSLGMKTTANIVRAAMNYRF